MASGGSSGRTSSGPRSFDFFSDDALCAYDDYISQDPSNGKRSDPSPKDFHESRMGRPLVSVYGQQDEYPKVEIIDAIEKCMKKYADNLLRQLDGISGRLSQLEIYCYKLERSTGEFRADMIRDQGQADTKLKSLKKYVQKVHRSIQILRDKQELAETQKELTKLQLAPKEYAFSTQSQKSEEAIAPSSVSMPKRHDDISDILNQHLALALPHQILPPSRPTRTPDQNQLPMQQQQLPPLPHQPAPASLAPLNYVSSQSVPSYPQHSQALQPEIQYMQPRPQIQDSTQAPPPQQPQAVNQPQEPQPFPQYQQQWSQPPSQQFTRRVVVPTQQASLEMLGIIPRAPIKIPQRCVWSPPRFGSVALNIDGSCIDEKLAVGGVLRNRQGTMLSAVAGPVGKGNCLQAEIWALHYGLLLLRHLDITRADIRSDSKKLVDHMGRQGPSCSVSKDDWSAIQVLFDNSLSSIQHCVRECNQVADGLSKWGHSLPSISVFFFEDDLPLRIRTLIDRDARGWAYFRS